MEEFSSEYYSLQRPLLVVGNLTSQMSSWQFLDKSSFLNRYGELVSKTGDIPYPEAYGQGSSNHSSLREFVSTMEEERKYRKQINNSSLLSFINQQRAKIAFDNTFVDTHPHLLDTDFRTPSLFANVCRDNQRFFNGRKQMSIGGAFSGAPLHSHVYAWNVVFKGVKRWY